MKAIVFLNINCQLWVNKYSKPENHSLQLVSAMDDDEREIHRGELVCTASVNPPVKLRDNEIAIKNWSENEGVLQVLQANGIVSEVRRKVPSGFVLIDICEFYPEVAAQFAYAEEKVGA